MENKMINIMFEYFEQAYKNLIKSTNLPEHEKFYYYGCFTMSLYQLYDCLRATDLIGSDFTNKFVPEGKSTMDETINFVRKNFKTEFKNLKLNVKMKLIKKVLRIN